MAMEKREIRKGKRKKKRREEENKEEKGKDRGEWRRGPTRTYVRTYPFECQVANSTSSGPSNVCFNSPVLTYIPKIDVCLIWVKTIKMIFIFTMQYSNTQWSVLHTICIALTKSHSQETFKIWHTLVLAYARTHIPPIFLLFHRSCQSMPVFHQN